MLSKRNCKASRQQSQKRRSRSSRPKLRSPARKPEIRCNRTFFSRRTPAKLEGCTDGDADEKDNATLWDNILSDKTKTETLLDRNSIEDGCIICLYRKDSKAPETLQLKSVIKDGIEREVELLNSNSLDLGREIAGKEAGLKELKRLEHVLGLDETGVCAWSEKELGTQKPVLIKNIKQESWNGSQLLQMFRQENLRLRINLPTKRDELKVCNVEIVELGKTIIRLENDKGKHKLSRTGFARSWAS
ncbi:MAG: hypothetical protein IPJ75_19830 [Ignavibacteriales bacterium]|nr:hypothetical protein [Ignavibacteriales bacterium]